VLQGIVT